MRNHFWKRMFAIVTSCVCCLNGSQPSAMTENFVSAAIIAENESDDIIASGECGAEGDNLTWTLDSDGLLRIEGEGEMQNYGLGSGRPWYSRSSEIKTAELSNGITTIGNYAFAYCSKLTSITIPESVTTIGIRAFEDCSGLTEIKIPDSVTTIGYGTFWDCSGLTSITIPDGVITIGNYAFYNCSGLTSITIPDGVITIGNYAFYNCSGLTSITIPDSVTTIGDCAFYGCSGLTKFSVSNNNPNYTSIEDVLFSKNIDILIAYPIGKNDTSYKIPESVTTIGDYAFAYCSGLTEIKIPDSVTTIGKWAFCDCLGLTEIKIPDSVTTIGDCAFYGCSGLTEIIIPESVTTIGDFAFYECSGLTSITIPDSVTTIGELAFAYCSGLTSITIPDGVITIGNYAFYHCSRLNSITIQNSSCEINNSADTIPDTATIYGYAGSTAEAYAQKYGRTFVVLEAEIIASGECGAEGDNLTWTLDSDGLLRIEGEGEMQNYELGSDIPWYSRRSEIKTAELSDGITTIGESAFQGCSGLTSITIPDSVTTIGEQAFYWCSGLTEIIIPDSVTTIGDCAFYNCSGLTKFSVSNNNPNYTSIDDVLFSKNIDILIAYPIGKNDTSYKIPESVTTIGERAFSDCSGLTSITIPDSVTTIDYCAFEYCSGLTSITIPDSVITIGKWAFEYCSGLTSITIQNPSCEIYDLSNTISDTATIYGYAGSTAEAYAQKYGRTFVALEEPQFTTTTTSTTTTTTTTTTSTTTTTTTTTTSTTTTTTTTTTSTTTTTTTTTSTTTTTTTTTTSATTTTTTTTTSATTTTTTTTTSAAYRPFVFADDTWQFENIDKNFRNSFNDPIMTPEDLEYLDKQISPTLQEQLKSANNMLTTLKNSHGTCYGMASMALMNLYNLFKPSDLCAGATTLREVSLENNFFAISKINYHHLLQIIWQSNTINGQAAGFEGDEKDKIQRIIADAEAGKPMLIGLYHPASSNRHVVMGYGISYASEREGYDAVIYTYDPNENHFENHSNYDIYLNTQTAQWYIPETKWCNADKTSKSFSQIAFVLDDIDIISANSMYSTNAASKRLLYPSMRILSKHAGMPHYLNETGLYGAEDDGIVKKCLNGFFGDDNTETATTEEYIMKYKEAPYSFYFDDEDSGNADVECYYSQTMYRVQSANLCNAIFYPRSVSIRTDSDTPYFVKAIRDDAAEGALHTIEISGNQNESETVKLQECENGWILQSQAELKRLQISGESTQYSITDEIATASKSAYICMHEDGMLSAYIDTDGDGIYETNVNQLDKADVNCNGAVTVADAVAMARCLTEDDAVYYQDVDADGILTLMDVRHILEYLTAARTE